MKLKNMALTLGIPILVSSGAAYAGVSASALFEVTGFLIKDQNGVVLDRNTDFVSLTWTGSADEDVFLDGVTDKFSDANTTTGVNFPVICLGDCPQIASDVFPVITGAPIANYSTADQIEVDAPITNLGSFGTPANVGNGAYAAIASGEVGELHTASANSNNGLEASFILSRDVTISFDGMARVYSEVFVSADELFPGKAAASTDFVISITNLGTGQVVYTERPAPLQATLALNANEIPFDLQLAGTPTLGDALALPLAALPSIPLYAGNLYQLSIRNNVNVDVSRIQGTPDDLLGCRLTGGGVSSETLDDGAIVYAWNGDVINWKDSGSDENRYQMAGQVGANTSGLINGQPKGEWNHHQQRGPFGSFSFHGGTASAPAGTEIIAIRCSDPGGCFPSGNPPSPNKQLDFDGVGTFKNLRNPGWLIPNANVTAEGRGNKDFDGTFHYFEVNVDDLGEGPDPSEGDSTACPDEGFGEKGADTLPANCDCPDFYRITIFNGVSSGDATFLPDGSIDPSTLNKTDVIYEVSGYLGRGGNGLQLHDLTGFDKIMSP